MSVKGCSLSFTHLEDCDRRCGETTIDDGRVSAEKLVLHYRTCACCRNEMFERAEPLWWDDESETCSLCGCVNAIRVDDVDINDDPTADTVLACGPDCPCDGCAS